VEYARFLTSKEVDAMRPSRLWNTYRQIRLERYLVNVPATEKRNAKTFAAGKWMR